MIRFTLLFVFFILGCQKNFKQNNLGSNRSLYLKKGLQHKIWWQTWDKETLEYAKENNKLIFVSLGYGTSYPCNKMDHLVYEKARIADALNKYYVSIRVDREDQPDLDTYFLHIQSVVMRYAAWPTHLILSPDLKPLFAFSYVTEKNFLKIVNDASNKWLNKDPKLLQQSQKIIEQVQSNLDNKDPILDPLQLIKDFYARYTHQFDTIYGGKKVSPSFTPKFPINDDLRLLLRYYGQTNEKQALKMVEKTLTTLAKSATFDQLAGGIHRYSLTRDWNSPNFEKILIDQASFINAMLDMYRLKNNDLYQKTIEKTVAFVLRDLSAHTGGFYSSINDSYSKHEGAFYTWSQDDLSRALTAPELKTFNEFYFLNGSHGRYGGRQTLRKKTSFVKPEMQAVEDKLDLFRKSKAQLETDDKVVTAYNAFILSALAKVERLWPSTDFINIIKKNLDFILRQHSDYYGNLKRRSITGKTRYPAVLNDYAFLIDALIEFYQLSYDESYLTKAKALQTQQDLLFFDNQAKLYNFSSLSNFIPLDQKILRDQNLPSGISMSYWNLQRLALLYQNPFYKKKADKILHSYPDRIKVDPLSYSHLLLGVDFHLSNPKLLIISGSSDQCRKASQQMSQKFFPYVVFACSTSKSRQRVVRNKVPNSQHPTYFVCDQTHCSSRIKKYEEARGKVMNNDG